MKKAFILGISGSPKKDGYVGGMLKSALGEAQKHGALIRRINLVDYKILPHSGELKSSRQYKDDMQKLVNLVLRADGLIFATPTHWFSTSSIMKLFIDRLTSLEEEGFLLEGKAAGFITYGPQGGALNSAMQLSIIADHWGMISPPYACVFDEGRNDSWVKRDCKLLGKNLVQLINLSLNNKLNWGY